jgi:hypothetical protein
MASGPSSEISSLSFSEFADTTERRFYEGPMLVEDLSDVKSLYKREGISRGTGSQRIFQEFDSETYAHYKAEGADATKVQALTGWSKTMTVRRFAAEIDITYEAREYGKNQEIIRKLTSLATFCPQKLALDLTHRFTFCTATSYTDLDGETVDTAMGYTTSTALVDATHDLTGSSGTYSNVVTGNPEFSQGAYETALGIANNQIVSNFNERRVIPKSAWRIVSSDDPSTIRQIRQLMDSMGDVDGAHSGIVNVYKNQMTHIKLPRLATTATGAYNSAKVKYWGLVASGEWNGYLGIWEEPNLKKPAPGNNGEDIHNDNWTFGARCGYGIAVVSGRGVIWSTGVGA